MTKCPGKQGSIQIALLAITLALSSGLKPASAEIVIYMGDAIGTDSTATDGNVAIAAQITTFGDPTWKWDSNQGAPAFQYSSDGIATFHSFRAITTIVPRNESQVQWNQANWAIDVWDRTSYLLKTAPLVTANLGSTPTNWSGFTTLANGAVIPNAAAFGSPEGNTPPGTDSYELDFNLSNHSAFASPLPIGEYIVSFTARLGANFF